MSNQRYWALNDPTFVEAKRLFYWTFKNQFLEYCNYKKGLKVQGFERKIGSGKLMGFDKIFNPLKLNSKHNAVSK